MLFRRAAPIAGRLFVATAATSCCTPATISFQRVACSEFINTMAPPAAAVAPVAESAGSGDGAKSPNHPRRMEGDWLCPSCGTNNFRRRDHCFDCGTPRNADGSAQQNTRSHRAAAGGAGGRVKARKADWTCDCGTLNFASRRECMACGMFRPEAIPTASGDSSNSNRKGQKRPGDWMCSCGFHNFASRSSCFSCGLSRSSGTSVSVTSSGSSRGGKSSGVSSQWKTGDWNCEMCGFINFASRTSCKACEAARPEKPKMAAPLRDGDWVCTSCNAVNFARRTSCYMCDRPKGEGAEAATPTVADETPSKDTPAEASPQQ